VTATPDDIRLYDLFVRYWDNTLSADEAEVLERRLATDPEARAAFQLFTMQAVAAAELPAVRTPASRPHEPEAPAPAPAPSPAPATKRGWTRRRVLQYVGGGLAAGVGGIALGRWLLGDSGNQVRLIAVQGTVSVRTADGRTIAPEGPVPSGATVSTAGFASTAVLAYRDGSTVSLIGDSALTVHDNGQRLRLHQGTASADIRPREDEDDRLTLVTPLVTLAAMSGVLFTLGQGVRATEVEVQQGSVAVSAPSGEPLAVVREGELLTVGANGARRQQPTPPTPDEFAWDLTRPLPEGWHVGSRETTPDGPVVRTARYPDPYYQHTEMSQIRSDHQWTRGFFRLFEESVVHVRYRAARAMDRGQVCFCVRTSQSRCSDTGMLEYNGGFKATEPGKWEELHIRAVDMLSNKHTPKFGAPWIGFLVIFNTFETEIGLEVSEFRVTAPRRLPG
jgi:ferric-dicitrate binding protein FerR (iron transport regulator)